MTGSKRVLDATQLCLALACSCRGQDLFLPQSSSQGALQQVALVFERLDTVVEHLLHSPELEAQPLQLRRVQLVRLLAVRAVQSADRLTQISSQRFSFGFICQWRISKRLTSGVWGILGIASRARRPARRCPAPRSCTGISRWHGGSRTPGYGCWQHRRCERIPFFRKN